MLPAAFPSPRPRVQGGVGGRSPPPGRERSDRVAQTGEGMQPRRRPGGRSGGPRGSAPRGQGRGSQRAGRAPSRPTVARRAVLSPGGAAMRTRAPQPRRFTSRAVVLSLVLLVLLLAYAYPVRVYLAQQAEIAALEESQQRQTTKVAEMQARAKKWDDPEYV